MWQVKIPFKNEFEKEKIILASYLNKVSGIEELNDALILNFRAERDAKNTVLSLSSESDFIKKVEEGIDWVSRWKRFHKVIKIKPFLIVPAFKKGVRKDNGYKKKIIINPSFAFGTGSHPTTKMCIKFLVEEIRGGEKILDIGTGSGILAICAEKLGAKEILAVDIDEIALKEAEKNIKRNRCKKIRISKYTVAERGFDLVVCNILLNTVLELKKDILKSLKKGGRVIVAGILTEQKDELLTNFLDKFRLIRKRQDKDKSFRWTSFLFEKL